MRPSWPRRPIEYVAWAFVSVLLLVSGVVSAVLLSDVGFDAIPGVLGLLYIASLVFVGVVFDVVNTAGFRIALWAGIGVAEVYRYAVGQGGLVALVIAGAAVLLLGNEFVAARRGKKPW